VGFYFGFVRTYGISRLLTGNQTTIYLKCKNWEFHQGFPVSFNYFLEAWIAGSLLKSRPALRKEEVERDTFPSFR
jgi:hypothetical protein